MNKYNSAFFGLYENLFLVLKEELGEEKAFELFQKIMEQRLKKAYDVSGFEKGNVNDFVRVLKERDESVGLHVEFPTITLDKIVYQFHTDPFPGLKGCDLAKLDDTYMGFKVRYLLGDEWSYKTTKHIWKGDAFTEHIISRN